MPKETQNLTSVEQIKTDLEERCRRISFHDWSTVFPDLQVPLNGSIQSSPSLPSGFYGSHEYDGNDKKLPVRHVMGHDEIETFLARNGKIFEKLVHFDSDGPDSDKRYPDEILREVGDKEYQDSYEVAMLKLDHLEKHAQRIRERSII